MREASLWILVAGVVLIACAGGRDDAAAGGRAAARVTGTVSYRERIALPPTAMISVQLVDVSRADAPADVLGEQVLHAEGRQVPFAFEIPYQPGKIDPSHTYAVQARIEVDGKLRFITDRRHAVLTRGAPSHVAMILKGVGG